ncbi:hypothetical protein KI387_023002, partial [Taxus chinensis]
GGCVTIGICATMGTDETMFRVVDEGMVETAGATNVVDAVARDDKGPSCETNGDRVGEGNVEPEGVD